MLIVLTLKNVSFILRLFLLNKQSTEISEAITHKEVFFKKSAPNSCS